MFLTVLFYFYEEGHTYDASDKKVLRSVEKSTKNIVIDQKVENIYSESTTSSAFFSCKDVIQSVSFASESQCKELGTFLFSGTTITKIDFSNCKLLTTISKGCFNKCTQLSTVTLPPNVITLSSGAFESCNKLTTITFPDSLEILENYDQLYGGAFQQCSKLTKVIITEKSNLKSIGSYAFQYSSLTSFYIPKNVSSIGKRAFSQCPITQFTRHPDNANYVTEDTAIYDKSKTNVYCVTGTDATKDFTLPSTVVYIAENAFKHTTYKAVIFTNQNVEIESAAFFQKNVL